MLAVTSGFWSVTNLFCEQVTLEPSSEEREEATHTNWGTSAKALRQVQASCLSNSRAEAACVRPNPVGGEVMLARL